MLTHLGASVNSHAFLISSLSAALLMGVSANADEIPNNVATGQVATGVDAEKTEILNPPERVYAPEKRPKLAEVARRIVDMTNDLRKQKEVAKIKLNPQLSKAAGYFADYMARTSRYGHKADGQAPDSRAKKYEYQPCIIAENIAYDYNSSGFTMEELAKSLFEGWKASPGHHRNMVDPDVIEIGVAIAQSEGGYFFAVQDFGRPESMAVEVRISNRSETAVTYKMGDETFEIEPRVTRTHRACRLRDLAFRWSNENGREETVQPHDGDRFVVVQDGDGIRLRHE